MKRLVFAGAAALLALSSVPARADSRLAERAYSAEEVVRIDGRLGVQATIAFAEDEHIENVAVGDSNAWQITPNKRANLLFVKPLAGKARTNMTVITDRRRYYFDLVASPAAKPLYVLNFTYPDDDKKAAQAATAPTTAPLTEAEQLALGEDAALLPVDPADLNFKWARKGDRKLMPSRIYDDGAATYISWAVGNPVPAILIRNEKGEEGPVNFAVRGDVIVIDDVPGLIVLRSGKASAELVNQGDPRKPAGQANGNGAALAAADSARNR
jgi:type IV secretion system protein VirB9